MYGVISLMPGQFHSIQEYVTFNKNGLYYISRELTCHYVSRWILWTFLYLSIKNSQLFYTWTFLYIYFNML